MKPLEKGSDWGFHHTWNWNGFICHWRYLGKTNNQPIVLIHGFGASSEHWRNNVKGFLEAGFCVYAIDLIGFGKSEQPSPKKIKSLENKFWANQIKSFLEEIVLKDKYKKAILIGNSLGGLVALTTLVFWPNLIKAIVAAPLPDPTLLKRTINSEKYWQKKINHFFIKLFFNLLPLEIIVPLISRTKIINLGLDLAYFSNISSDKELKKIVRVPARKKSAPKALRAMCIGMSLRKNDSMAPNLLKKLSNLNKKPAFLMIWGKEDKLVPLFIGKIVLKMHPWIKLSIVENSGHCPHDESPKHFNSYVLNWLEINLKATRPKE